MKMRLRHLLVRTRRTTERLDFAEVVTFLHGPVSTGKSTVARLINYCMGGDLERTPAVQQEFVSAELGLMLGEHECTLERSAEDTGIVRVTWSGPSMGSVNAPTNTQPASLMEDLEVHSFSDLIFHLCGVTPIKVRKRSRDPESPLVRLSIRDIWRYCYLDQTHMDSSFFRLEDPFRGRKSQDAMRFFTGLHSERLAELETELMRAVDDQRSKREAVQQIRSFMDRFEFGSELDVAAQLENATAGLASVQKRAADLERARHTESHPTDDLRDSLRELGAQISSVAAAIADSREVIDEQTALRAELITAKTKAERVDHARDVLEGVRYERCPECGAEVSDRMAVDQHCRLCGSLPDRAREGNPMELEAFRRDLNERIDQIADSIERRKQELARSTRRLTEMRARKATLDRRLGEELARYDSVHMERVRELERTSATLLERVRFLKELARMPQAVNELEERAGALQGQIDRLRTTSSQERERLTKADANIAAIADEFKRIMLAVSFPGVTGDDQVTIDARNWRPTVVHGEQVWSFWDAGSGGKKTLFNVCYALAVHASAMHCDMPVPGILIIDSPTKNISEDENPELVRSLYDEIYRLAAYPDQPGLQFLLIDSDLVPPSEGFAGFCDRRMADEPGATSLIPYYTGP